MRTRSFRAIAIGVLATTITPTVQAGQAPPAAQEHVATLKATLAASQAALRQYEWIETTIVTFKGEEKSRKEERCYYGADGVLQKVPLTAPPPASGGRGLRGRVAAHKKEELTDYMKQAVGLVKQYAPPDPARIQAVKDAGRLSLQPMPGAGKQVRLVFAGYLIPTDNLAVELDLATNKVLRSTVATSLGEDPVALTVAFATLTDGSSFTKDIVLDAVAQKVRVEVQHSGYRKAGQ